MPTVDSTAEAQIDTGKFAPAYFIWVDVVGDPIRITTFGSDITFASTGDTDLDGNTFKSFDHRAISVGDVTNSDGGSDTLTVDLSGIVSIDGTLMGEIANTANWRGRTVRLWMRVYDETGTNPEGAVVPYYTGYASSVKVIPSPETQSIRLEVEHYLALFNQASNRSYLNQKDYDSADTSAQATLAAANMGRGTSTGGTGGSGGGSGRGGRGGLVNVNNQ